jgi:hypothetical protein
MRLLRVASALLLAGTVSSAGAQIVPPPLTATVVNFDELAGCASLPCPLFPPDTYTSIGLTITGFGQNGATVFDAEDSSYLISPPNSLFFFSVFPLSSGGLIKPPETFSFYPPVQSLQFDTATFSGCDLIVTAHAFAPNGDSLGSTTTVPVEGGVTLSVAFPAPGAQKVVITDTPNPVCGTPGLEAFSIDNIAFVTLPLPSSASRCAQSALDAAGKKAKAEASCYSKALQNGVDVDPACLQKATDNFDKGFTKAQGLGDCLTDTDGPTVEASVDGFVSSAIALVTGGSPGPDICFGKKLVAIGKKAQSFTKCSSKAAKSGTTVDEMCAQKAAQSFNASLKKCGTPTQLAPVEALIDQFGNVLARSLTVPTTTTTTTTTSTTTTTTAPPLGPHLTFTTAAGTANCVLPTPDPPFSGEIDSDVAATTKISDLGAGCLYIGGGAAAIPPSIIPENAASILDSPDGTSLVASFGTGPADCTRGPAATQHCITDPTIACTTDVDCGGAPGSCAFDANCFFGPPVPVNGFPSTCVVNTFAQDASGTINTTSGDSSVSITLASRVFITLGQPSVCPTCDGGACNWGANAGGACTTSNAGGTSLDCLPGSSLFIATLPVDLTPLTTGPSLKTAADGLFCAGQSHPGAFGQAATLAIQQTGVPSGDLTDGLPHQSTLVSTFCIPPTGNAGVDATADLPGPGSLSLPGNAQFSSPSGAFLAD